MKLYFTKEKKMFFGCCLYGIDITLPSYCFGIILVLVEVENILF